MVTFGRDLEKESAEARGTQNPGLRALIYSPSFVLNSQQQRKECLLPWAMLPIPRGSHHTARQ